MIIMIMIIVVTIAQVSMVYKQQQTGKAASILDPTTGVLRLLVKDNEEKSFDETEFYSQDSLVHNFIISITVLKSEGITWHLLLKQICPKCAPSITKFIIIRSCNL